MLRSLTTFRPASSAGRTTCSMCWARSAAMSRASALSVISLWAGSARIARTSFADGRAAVLEGQHGVELDGQPPGVRRLAAIPHPPRRRCSSRGPWRSQVRGRVCHGRAAAPRTARAPLGRLLRLGGRLLRRAASSSPASRRPWRPSCSAPPSWSPALLGHLLAPDGQELVGPLRRHLLQPVAPAERGVGLAVGHVDAEPALLGHDRPLAHRVGAELPQRRLGRRAAPPAELPRLGEHRQRLVEGDRRAAAPRSPASGSPCPCSRTARSGRSAATTSWPSAGSTPTTRGSESSSVASSSVIRSERHGLEQRRHLRLGHAGRRCVGVAPLHVGPEAAVLGEHRQAVEERRWARRPWARPAADGLLDGQLVGRHGPRGRWRCPRPA